MNRAVVTLKNNSKELEIAVKSVMFTVRHLLKQQPLVFYDLVMRCRDREYEMWSETEDGLKKLSLLQPDGQPHGTTKNIILSAVEGDEGDMYIVNPILDGK